VTNYSVEFEYAFSRFSQQEKVKVWLSLSSLKRDQIEINNLTSIYAEESFDKIINDLFKLNLTLAIRLFSDKKKVVATSFMCSSICNQMTFFADRFDLEPNYHSLALAFLPLMTSNETYSVNDFSQFTYFAIPNLDYNQQLSFIAAIFLPETNQFVNWSLPEHTVRIGCPHGVDIPLEDTLLKYGGALQFEYIIQATTKSIAPINYSQYVASSLVQHNADTVCIIPMGIPKLDKLYKQVNRSENKERCIAYHLSNWQLETQYVRENIKHIVATLLENYPNTKIIVRPFPADRNRVDLLEQLAPFIDNANFYISENSSYIDDYAQADVLITHREHTGQNFSLATGRATITLINNSDKDVLQSNLGYQVFSIEQLLNRLNHCFNDKQNEYQRISQYSKSLINNLGTSLDYLVGHFDSILNREVAEDWLKLKLNDSDFHKLKKELQVERCLTNCIQKGKPSIQLVGAAIQDAHKVSYDAPYLAVLHYYGVMSYSRCPDPFQHQYYFLHWLNALRHFKYAIELSQASDVLLIVKLNKWFSLNFVLFVNGVSCFYDKNKETNNVDEQAFLAELKSEKFKEKYLLLFQTINQEKFDAQCLYWPFSIDKLLMKIPVNHSEVYLYGAGDIAKEVIYFIERFTSLKILEVFDKNEKKYQEKLLGYQINSIECIKQEVIPIIICSFAFRDEIELELQNRLPKTTPLIKLNTV